MLTLLWKDLTETRLTLRSYYIVFVSGYLLRTCEAELAAIITTIERYPYNWDARKNVSANFCKIIRSYSVNDELSDLVISISKATRKRTFSRTGSNLITVNLSLNMADTSLEAKHVSGKLLVNKFSYVALRNFTEFLNFFTEEIYVIHHSRSLFFGSANAHWRNLFISNLSVLANILQMWMSSVTQCWHLFSLFYSVSFSIRSPLSFAVKDRLTLALCLIPSFGVFG